MTLDGIHRLGFSCFRLVYVYDPEVAYAYRRVHETRSRMAALARHRVVRERIT